jgi:hypothetical protein
MNGPINLELAAQVADQHFTAAVNKAARLPVKLDVWTALDVLDYPDQLRVTTGDTELASLPIKDAAMLGSVYTAIHLGRLARTAYNAGAQVAAECA